MMKEEAQLYFDQWGDSGEVDIYQVRFFSFFFLGGGLMKKIFLGGGFFINNVFILGGLNMKLYFDQWGDSGEVDIYQVHFFSCVFSSSFVFLCFSLLLRLYFFF